jgi:hypothetical protein
MKKIKRKDMKDHRSQCPQEPVECPFAEAGCKVDVCRQQFEDHMTTSLHQHVMLLMVDRKQLKREWMEMKTELNEVKAKLSQAESALHEAESRLEFCEAFNNKLKKSGDTMQVTMPKFSEYRRSEKVWHSPPFYYGEGYKMCLAVHANGVGAEAGTYISVELFRLRGEYDDQLKWPVKRGCKHSLDAVFDGVCRFLVCRIDQYPPINERIPIGYRNKFCRLNDEKILHMVNDCLRFCIQHDDCYLRVEINVNYNSSE